MTTHRLHLGSRDPGSRALDPTDAASGAADPTGGHEGVVLRPFRTPVRGHAFAARPPGSSAPEAGQGARLVREPDNPADPLAVAVWTEQDGCWWRVGYLDRGVAARVTPRLDGGARIEARLDGWVAEPCGRWRRPVVLLLPRLGRRPRDAAPPGQVDLAAEDGRSGRLWGRPPGVVVRPVRPRAR
jgi:hypothetical protein